MFTYNKIISLSPKKSMSIKVIWLLFVIPSCVFSANDLYRHCSEPFNCGDQSGLLYPFWIPGREECGHPKFKLECNTNFAEVSFSSVKFRILDADYISCRIRLARSDFINNVCPHDPLNVSYMDNVLPFAPNTELLTIYYGCNFSLEVYTFGGMIGCRSDEIVHKRNYYVTRNLSSPLLKGVGLSFKEFGRFCERNVSIPASGHSLNALQTSPSVENLGKALEDGFELALDQECVTCIGSGGACGYNKSSSGFICYCVDEPHNGTCGSRKNGIPSVPLNKIGGTLFLVLVLTLFLLILRKRRTSHDLGQQNLKTLIPQPRLKALITLKQYSYAQVKRITNSFSEQIGRGGFGIVYRGTLCDGSLVAVKVFKNLMGDNGEDFINEVASMSQTSHVNIVTLLGFCSEGSKRAIIYEYLENGSLDKFITEKTSMDIDWATISRIALGVGRGLEYLHHGCKTRIVHFDIKPQNVLLDENFIPKVSDFGLAKLCEKKESILSLLDTRGTIGYIAPELFSRMYGRVSHKSDVYSYGMLVLEMIGARNQETAAQSSVSNTSSMYFPEWIYKDLDKGHSGRLMENGISIKEEELVKKMTLVGLWCIQSSPSDRPAMNRVVEMLEGNVDAIEVPPKPFFQIPSAPFEESSLLLEDISGSTSTDKYVP
ncbi:PREDICTED: LEAF RUST 10 DISEASE-RESISTANCE LOCUS RECEPTOR-LIKE PROTEIN KINASE-like 2.5 isoform X2 [Camelina sativa]|uniref:non-specific serine/threonine protein kinase n=1 Tax=Camelina sativa TaxID=90675 RepID=A0ABM1Q8W2_CAMSA|nr:PREDICTED: LEAF RUST 10 DISEASE-RESISTANCE LOCUS RECEPTOR-LIKE PROTEIN KINASE-like 2.5 isoform X2 [Camelina sativa]